MTPWVLNHADPSQRLFASSDYFLGLATFRYSFTPSRAIWV
nr:MAG TPA: hypothetical protein [Caudoviricetes sp.]